MGGTDAMPSDGGQDVMPLAIACPQDPSLLICLSFDALGWTSPYNNEGALPVTATLTNVTRTTVGNGGAALLDATSEVVLPPDPMLVGFAAMVVRVRFDADIPAGGRVGLIDADKTTPG